MDTAQWPQEIVVKPIEEIIVPNSNSSIPSTSKPSSNSNGGGSNPSLERRVLVRPTKDQVQALNCPRCKSTNTKFCYYNNYSLTQPRYFCKTCRRYWTEGGSLRNIPVGGGSRKNKRSSSSSSSSSKIINGGNKPPPPAGHHDHHHLQVVPPALPAVLHMASLSSHHHPHGPNPNNYKNNINNSLHDSIRSLHHHHLQHGQDLNLGFPSTDNDFKTISELIQVPNFDGSGEDGNCDHALKNPNSSPPSTTTTSTVTTCINAATTASAHQQFSALELLTRGSGGLMNSFMQMPIHPDPNAGAGAGVFSSSGLIPVQEFKLPSLSFSLDGIGNGTYGGSLHHQENCTNGGRLLFPFEDLKHVTTSSTTTPRHDHDHGGINDDNDDQNRDPNGDSGGYWNGMLGGASW